MYLIFKLKARIFRGPRDRTRRSTVHSTAANPLRRRSQHHNAITSQNGDCSCNNTSSVITSLTACCVFSSFFVPDPDDEDDNLMDLTPAQALQLLISRCQISGDERKALQRHEVERSCQLGMSVGLLEDIWMEKIVIELQKIEGKRRRRIKRLGNLPKNTGYLGPYDVVPIHKYPDLVSQCCRLINAEWPRSEVARMRSLQSSSDSLPTNLVLTRDYKETVLAHVKLSPIPSRPNGCFIESMVVRKVLRGQGLGKLLMQYAEDYAADFLRCDEMYLSTIDSIGFYEKQHYEICQPVNMYGLSMGYVPQSNNAKKVYMKKALHRHVPEAKQKAIAAAHAATAAAAVVKANENGATAVVA